MDTGKRINILSLFLGCSYAEKTNRLLISLVPLILLACFACFGKDPAKKKIFIDFSHPAFHRLEKPYRLERGNIYYYDVKGDSFRLFTGRYKGAVASVSPRGTYVAISGIEKSAWGESSNFPEEKFRILVFNIEGTLFLDTKLKKMGFSWAPTEDKLLITPLNLSEDFEDGSTESILIFDFKTKQTKKIYDHAYQFQWAQFDTNIYLLDMHNKVERYAVLTGKLEPTPYSAVNFSDNGLYYFYSNIYEDPHGIRLYKRKNNEEITKNLDSVLSNYTSIEWSGKEINSSTVRWVGRYLVMSDNNLSSTLIYDPEKRAVVKSFSGALVEIAINSEFVIADKDNRVKKIR
jgi:hypothetical protein